MLGEAHNAHSDFIKKLPTKGPPVKKKLKKKPEKEYTSEKSKQNDTNSSFSF